MRPQPKQREPFSRKRAMAFAFSLVFGILLGLAVARVGSAPPLGPLTIVVFLAAAIFVHELGHVVAALIVGFQVHSFAVGPLMLHREAAGMRFRRTGFMIGGLVKIVPVGLHDLGKRMLIVVSGGPTSSIAFAVLAFVLGRSFGQPLQSTWLNPFAVLSGAVAILSLIPMRSFYRSDGAQIWDWLRSPEKSERHCALLSISGAAKAGLRPRDWDGVLIAKGLSVIDDAASDVAANVIAYESAMDRRDFDLAEKHLEAALRLRHKCPKNVKSGLAMDAAFFYSIVRENSTLAHEWLNECDRRYIYDRYAILMVEAAVLLIDGESREAASKAQESASLLSKAQFPGFALAAKDWLDIILARAQTDPRETSAAMPLTSTQRV